MVLKLLENMELGKFSS